MPPSMVLQIPEFWSSKTQIKDNWPIWWYDLTANSNVSWWWSEDSNIWKKWILYWCWCPLMAAPVWLNWGGSWMELMSGQSSTSLWPLLRFFTSSPTLASACCCPLYWFYFVNIFLCVWVPDSRWIFYLRSDHRLETFVPDGGRTWQQVSQ